LTRVSPSKVVRPWQERLAAAPISWGACEVPGWGLMPEPERVLAEMEQLGVRATELGAPGFFPVDHREVCRMLERHHLELVGGFCPLVLHEPRCDAAEARDAALDLARAGGRILVLALVQDARWSAPQELDDGAWSRLADHVARLRALAARCGVTVALHPHVDTLIETAEHVQHALERLDVGWCLDTGHLLIAGVDPAQFAREHGDRVVLVHLKDVDATLAARLRAGRLSLLQGARQGLFLPLARGDARIGPVLQALAAHRYGGWLVLEQDTAITADEPAAQSAPSRDARQSIAFLDDALRA